MRRVALVMMCLLLGGAAQAGSEAEAGARCAKVAISQIAGNLDTRRNMLIVAYAAELVETNALVNRGKMTPSHAAEIAEAVEAITQYHGIFEDVDAMFSSAKFHKFVLDRRGENGGIGQ